MGRKLTAHSRRNPTRKPPLLMSLVHRHGLGCKYSGRTSWEIRRPNPEGHHRSLNGSSRQQHPSCQSNPNLYKGCTTNCHPRVLRPEVPLSVTSSNLVVNPASRILLPRKQSHVERPTHIGRSICGDRSINEKARLSSVPREYRCCLEILSTTGVILSIPFKVSYSTRD